MEEIIADLWWDVVQDIVLKNIGKVCRKYERNERLYKHKISQMERVMPSYIWVWAFSYVSRTRDFRWRRKQRGYKWGRTLGTKAAEQPKNLRKGKDSSKREVVEQEINF